MATKPVVYYNTPANTVTGNTINVDFSSTLTKDHESETPLTALLTRLSSKPALTHQYKFPVGRFAPRTATVSALVAASAVAAASTILLSDYGEYFLPGDVIEIQNNSSNDDATHVSQGIVTAVSSDTLTVKAYDPATYGVSLIPAGAIVRVMFSAMMEGSSGRPSRQTIPTVYENYVQTFEDYYNVTNLQAQNRQYIMPERVRLREEKRIQHALDIENALWLAKKVKDVTSGGTYGGSTYKPVYQMDGIIAQISSNSLTYGASMSQDELFDFMRTMHSPQYSGGNRRTVFASADLLAQVTKLPMSLVRISTTTTSWGLTITNTEFMGFNWQWILTPALTDARSGWGIVTHPQFMRLRPFIPTTFKMNVQGNKDNYFEDGFLTATSVEVTLEELFGVIKP